MEYFTKVAYSDAETERERRNRQVAYEAARESIVLLKNDGALPIEGKKIALFGAGVTHTTKGGTGSGEVNERHSVNILEGMEKEGFTITTKNWLMDFGKEYDVAKKAFDKKRIWNVFGDAMALMAEYPGYDGRLITEEEIRQSDSDYGVYVISRQAGEGKDRRAESGDLFLTEREKANISLCAKNYKHFILILNGGAAIDLRFLDEIEGIDAVVFMCQLGTEGGTAVAKLLSGENYPSGKLTDTWAKQYADIPFSQEFSYLNGDLQEEYYKEGIYVGYRYFDTYGVIPRYPFGYGLGYTDFAISDAYVSVEGTEGIVTATVTNTGSNYSGKEVVQVYVSAPEGKHHKEYQSLVAFVKTKELAPGEKQVVTAKFELSQLSSYDEANATFLLEEGDYVVRVGNSSRNTEEIAILQFTEEVVISIHENVCKGAKPFEELTGKRREKVTYDLPVISLSGARFETKRHTYEQPGICEREDVQAMLKKLTIDDMIELVGGAGMNMGFGGADAKFSMPGSVGNTTSKLWDKGLINVTLCDGPAGVRLQKRSAITAKGKIKPIDLAMSAYELIPKPIKKIFMGNPDKDQMVYQFTTAFPVECALAQTWNVELLEKVGYAIYEEMKEYGCTFWLAPAMNIHRNPLCGRNFEYFSEDPYLTGEMAAAITRGIQSEEGYYVTIKHFACNNQEDNRKKVNSNVSERALREIYLRGYERAIIKANAKSVMTSYNKVNGVYTPNSYDLCTKVLRNEWGFDGVVMTDWFSTSKGCGDTAVCMKIGNDLIMPGGDDYKKMIREGLNKGVITEEDIKRCAANVVKAVLDSALQKEYV